MYVVVTPPEEPAVSLEEMKAHLRVDHDDDDDEIESLVAAAQAGFEDPDIGWLRRPVALQQIEFVYDCFPARNVDLPGPILLDGDHPVVVKYQNSAGVDQVFSSASYRVDRASTAIPRLILGPSYAWPRPASFMRINCWAGFENDDPRIGNFQSAIKLHVEMQYDDVDRQKYQSAIDALLSTYRFREF
ncbi:head-tail connector protein [uncultured Bradyrhizobium sp.]|uniref:head-tail connector protein n=1 Tax=uncultured Bradyrhizobium sp. TaxID=199684 RepID=UPI0035CBF540